MRYHLLKKLNGGALQLTVFIAVIIALLLAGIVLLSYTHRYFTEQSNLIVDNIRLSDIGITYALTQDIAPGDTISINIPDATENQLLKLYVTHWGIYENAYVETVHRNKKFQKHALIGTGYLTDRPALYLQDTQKPLALVGNTLIDGKSYLPKQGIKSGNIAGNSYYKTIFINGTVKDSDTILPALSHNYIMHLRKYINEYMPNSKNSININNTKIINSFGNITYGFFSNNEIRLKDVSITGNIIIRSNSKIVVSQSALLNDVILAAPEIEIQDGTTGTFQAIADEKIKIGKNCELGYPSAFVLINSGKISANPQDPFHNQILIGESTIIKGSICYFSENSSDYKTNIHISENATITGEIFCNGNLELAGNVKGSVYTKHFVVNKYGSVFVNHLYNASISTRALPEQFGGIIFKGESKNVVKWMY